MFYVTFPEVVIVIVMYVGSCSWMVVIKKGFLKRETGKQTPYIAISSYMQPSSWVIFWCAIQVLELKAGIYLDFVPSPFTKSCDKV